MPLDYFQSWGGASTKDFLFDQISTVWRIVPFFGARPCYGNGQPPNQLSPACVALKAKRDLCKGAVKRVLSSRCSFC